MLFTDNTELASTPIHPAMSESGQFVPIGSLVPGDSVRGKNGPLSVAAAVVQHHPDLCRAYSITVQGSHTYVVHGSGVVVHSK